MNLPTYFILTWFIKSSIEGPDLRISSGKVARIDQFPFFAQLYLYVPVTEMFGNLTTCGASLIHPWWIVSAGHCFYSFKGRFKELEKSGLLRVFMGTNIRYGEKAVKNSIKKIHLHPQYFQNIAKNGSVLQIRNDIALGNLKTNYKMTRFISTISLAPPISNMKKWMRGCSPGTVVGIGEINLYGDNPENVLYTKEHLKEAQDLKVADTLLSINPNSIQFSKTFFTLAKWSKGHAMRGDSGGPFVCYYKKEAVLYGITSNVIIFQVNGYKYNVGVYERIDKHLDFIFKFASKASVYKNLKFKGKKKKSRKFRRFLTSSKLIE